LSLRNYSLHLFGHFESPFTKGFVIEKGADWGEWKVEFGMRNKKKTGRWGQRETGKK
jgi:hypothetical protein